MTPDELRHHLRDEHGVPVDGNGADAALAAYHLGRHDAEALELAAMYVGRDLPAVEPVGHSHDLDALRVDVPIFHQLRRFVEGR